MSAIWGSINLNQQPLSPALKATMEEPYHKYRIDSYQSQCIDHAIFGCCHQFLTPQAAQEKLPLLDEESHLLFTADAFLDNREELLDLLAADNSVKLCADSTDGDILYAAYKRWGNHFTDHCLGAFAVAVYDYAAHAFSLFTDHMNNRCIYYCIKDQHLYFSTVLASIIAVCPCDTSKKWAASCLSTLSPDVVIFEESTPYEGVYQLGAAQHLCVSKEQVTCSNYWNPLTNMKRPRFSSKVPYEQMVRQTVEQCTASLLRSAGEVGCTVSCGLDSTTVTAFAARCLPHGKILHSYTSVPLTGYKSDLDPFYITDERGGAEALRKQYPNIRPTYVECARKNAFSELNRLIPLLEYPPKSLQNITWLDEIYQVASRDNCRIILKGQYGNSTLSYGNIMTAVYQQLCSFRPITAAKSLRRFCQNHHVPFKKGCRTFLATLKARLTDDADYSVGSLLRSELFEEYKLKEYLYKTAYRSGGDAMDSWKERCRFLFSQQNLAQLSIYDTHFGLMYGLIVRDPLKDKRLIELCTSLPIECTVAGNVERALVRTYMKGIVPDSILENRYHRGLQGADMVYRMQMDWDVWKPKITELLSSDSLQSLLDASLFQELQQELQQSTAESLTEEFLQKVCILYSVSTYFDLYSCQL